MINKYIPMSGEEFIERFRQGERDFCRVKLPTGCDLTKYKGYNFITDKYDGVLNLRGADLCAINAPSINLTGANLRGADLMGATINKAKLANTNLEGAVLRLAKLNNAQCWSTNFKSSVMSSVEMIGAICERANFENATLPNALFSPADYRSVFCQGFFSTDLGSANFNGANIQDAFFYNVEVEGADFTNADLQRVTGLETARNLNKAIFASTFMDYEDWGRVLSAMPSTQHTKV